MTSIKLKSFNIRNDTYYADNKTRVRTSNAFYYVIGYTEFSCLS